MAENTEQKRGGIRGGAAALSLTVFVLTLAISSLFSATGFAASNSVAATPSDPFLRALFRPVIQQVPEPTSAMLAVLRKPVPEAIPPVVQIYGEVDATTGRSLFGMNPSLARPAYPAGPPPGKRHFWIVPGFDDQLVAIEFDGAGREVSEGGFVTVADAKFKKYGFIDTPLLVNRRGWTTIQGLMPDSITTIKTISSRPRKNKRSRRKSIVKTHTITDNVVNLRVKNARFIVVNGKKTRVMSVDAQLGDIFDEGVAIGRR